MKYSLVVLLVSLIFASCEKELSLENGKPTDPVIPEKEVSRKYQLKEFYSDTPIDFDETDDVIKSETNLWPYVYEYIKDYFINIVLSITSYWYQDFPGIKTKSEIVIIGVAIGEKRGSQALRKCKYKIHNQA